MFQLKIYSSYNLFFFILLASCSLSNAACNYSSTGFSSDWNDPLSWIVSGGGCSSIPPTGNVGTGITINIYHEIFVSGNLDIKNGAVLNIYTGGSLIMTGNLVFSNGSIVNIQPGGNLFISGNLTNNNNSTGIFIEGSVYVGGDLSAGQGSEIGPEGPGTGSITVEGAIFTDGTATVFGSTSDCPDSDNPCYTSSMEPLPVEFLGASVECGINSATLKWSTSSEINSSHFSIEVFNENDFWETIGIIGAVGNSNQSTVYEFVDHNREHLKSVFRLNQFDVDGQGKVLGEFSSDCNLQNEVIVYPNPSSENITLSFGSEIGKGDYLLELYSISGVLLDQIVVENGNGNSYVNLDYDLRGIYLIKVSNDSYSTKMMKQNFY